MGRKIIILFVMIMSITFCWGQEAKLQTGCIFHFAKHIEWPQQMRESTFKIVVVGDAKVATYLKAMTGKVKVGIQQVEVILVQDFANVQDAHMIVIGDNQLTNFKTAMKVAKQNHSLLITDSVGYGKKGSMINFTESNGRITFELNKNSVQQAGLKMSSRLVDLGIVI